MRWSLQSKAGFWSRSRPTETHLFTISNKYWTWWQAHSKPSLNTAEMAIHYKDNLSASLSTPTSALEKKVGVGVGVLIAVRQETQEERGAEFCFFPSRIWDHPTTVFSSCLPLYLLKEINKQATVLPFLSHLALANWILVTSALTHYKSFTNTSSLNCFSGLT